MKVEIPKYFPPQKREKPRKMVVWGSSLVLYNGLLVDKAVGFKLVLVLLNNILHSIYVLNVGYMHLPHFPE